MGYLGKFKGLNNKIKGWEEATENFKKDTYERVKWYSEEIRDELKKYAPKHTGQLKGSIHTIKKAKNNHVVTLYPHIPYWKYQEFGLSKARWVVVDTKPDLAMWVQDHPNVSTRKSYWPEMGTVVDMLWIGGTNTRLGVEGNEGNKFAYKGTEFIDKNHKDSLLFLAERFRKSIPQI